MTDPHDIRIELPPDLKRQLLDFERRLRRMETLVAIFGALSGLFLTYLLLFASDRFWDTPPLLRMALTLGGAAALSFGLWWWARHWLWNRRDARELAKLVQRTHRRLGDRLLGAVELAQDAGASAQISPALCRAAIRQVAEEAARFDFKQAAPVRRPRRFGLAFGLLLAIVAAIVAFFPRDAIRNAFSRWLKPLAPVERFTFVRLEDLPAEQVVPHGEDFEIAVALARQSVWKPAEASAQVDRQPRLKARVSGGRAVFRIPGQTETVGLTLRIGDVSRGIRIVPLRRPDLLRLEALTVLPDYLRRNGSTNAVTGGRVEFLEGSRLALLGTASRPLKEARGESAAGQTNLPVRGPVFTADFGHSAPTGAVAFTWVDTHGLASAEPYRIESSVTPDAPPAVTLEGSGRAVAILEDEVVELDAGARDDYGLQRLWIEWNGEDSKGAAVPAATGGRPLAAGAPDRPELRAPYKFSPVTAHVPEETMVSLRALSVDYYPDRVPSRSADFRIFVLSRTRHAQLIQQRMQQLQSRLDDLAREEERLLAQNTMLQDLPAEQLASDKSTETLQDSERGERQNQSNLEQLAEEAERLNREALRNREIDEKTLRELTEMAEGMRETAQGPMSQAQQSLQQAMSNTGERKESVKDAAENERKAIEQMRKLEKSMNQSMENMTARSFVNRLREAAKKEKAIAETLLPLLPEIVGANPSQLPEAQAGTLQKMSDSQLDVKKETKYIRDDLGGFYNRTQNELFRTVQKDMSAPDAVEEMEKLAGQIAANQGAQSVEQARRWEKKLTEWADQLDPEKDGGGGGGGGGGQSEQIDLETFIALMRSRVREEALREQTRHLEESRPNMEDYGSAAARLARSQFELAGDLRRVQPRVRGTKAGQFVEKIEGEMMNAGARIRRPDTGADTVAVQTEIIELIANAISASTSQSQQRQMSRLLTPQQGQAGGGSTAGGTTDRASTGGRAGIGGADDRQVDKTSGADSGALPEEFREAIEAYRNALEDKNR